MKVFKFLLLRRTVVYFLIVFSLFLTSCSRKLKTDKSKFDPCRSFLFECKEGKQIVEIYSSRGKMVLELDSNLAPLTVSNFLDLVNRGVYNETTFHRLIKEPFPFIIQGGDPSSKREEILISKIGLGNFVDPQNGKSRLIPLEIMLKKEDKPRYNKLIKNPNEIKNIYLKHERGSIAMARRESLNSASSQFYISLKRLHVLDGRYSVFGKIIDGIEILDLLKKNDRINKIVHIKDNDIFLIN